MFELFAEQFVGDSGVSEMQICLSTHTLCRHLYAQMRTVISEGNEEEVEREEI